MAWATLKGVPGDLLERGCAAARRSADHPSKVVPAIFAEIDAAWRARKADGTSQVVKPIEPAGQIEPPTEVIPPHEIRAMTATIRRMGLTKGWITQAQVDVACGIDSEPADPGSKDDGR